MLRRVVRLKPTFVKSLQQPIYAGLSSGSSFLEAKDFGNHNPPIAPIAPPIFVRSPINSATTPAIGTTTTSSSNSSSANNTTTMAESTFAPIKLGPNLTKYGVNMNKLASEGKLEEVIGRDGEIRKTMQILSRRRKNNPCLIGDPGVGKSAIVEGLARLIVSGDVPENMKDKVIISLDMAGMLAGTKFRGDFEERLKGVLKDVEQCGDRIIVFIDELHIIVGAGGSDGAIDASNILKPALARGQLRCLGATTTEEYSAHIEKDAALARRFQPVYVTEPTEQETVRILKGVREQYELHHKVHITDEAIATAVKLAGRYVTTRKFPDKAIDLIDEAASRIRNHLESKPAELAELDAKIATLDPLIASLKHMNSKAVNERERVRLVALRDKIDGTWRRTNELITSVFSLRKEVSKLEEEYRQNKTSAHSQYLLGRQVEIVNHIDAKRKEIAGLLETMPAASQTEGSPVSTSGTGNGKSPALASTSASPNKFVNSLTGQDLAEVVSETTGIPVSTMLGEEERASLLSMEAELRKSIIGQDEAIATIARCIRLSRAGLRYHDRPLGVFLMLGPTGVGKTELAKALSAFLFKDHSDALLRVDMSEYMEKFSVSRLIGAPPGYVGYEEGGVLTDAIRKRPYQVILLDEFEKAHREVSNLLLQVFDEGRLTDSQGRVVDFRNTVIIMTSNLGTETIRNAEEAFRTEQSKESSETEGGTDQEAKTKDAKTTAKEFAQFKSNLITRIVNQQFSPEFVNRLDDIVAFNQLQLPALEAICDIQLGKVQALLKERDIALEVRKEVRRHLSESSSGTGYGARPLKRMIQNSLLNPLASLLLENKVVAGDKIVASLIGSPMESTATQSFAVVESEQSSGEATDIRFWVARR